MAVSLYNSLTAAHRTIILIALKPTRESALSSVFVFCPLLKKGEFATFRVFAERTESIERVFSISDMSVSGRLTRLYIFRATGGKLVASMISRSFLSIGFNGIV